MFQEPNGVLVLANKIQRALRFKSKGAKPAAQVSSQGEVVVRADKTKRSYASYLRVTSSVVAEAVFVITYESLKFELVVEKRSLEPLSFPYLLCHFHSRLQSFLTSSLARNPGRSFSP